MFCIRNTRRYLIYIFALPLSSNCEFTALVQFGLFLCINYVWKDENLCIGFISCIVVNIWYRSCDPYVNHVTYLWNSIGSIIGCLDTSLELRVSFSSRLPWLEFVSFLVRKEFIVHHFICQLKSLVWIENTLIIFIISNE